MRRTVGVLSLIFLVGLFGNVRPVAAADPPWVAVTSSHFTVVSDNGERAARDIAAQMEQIRSAIHAIWPWTRVDLDKPMLVLAVRNEDDMKALAPRFWEDKNSVHPGSIFTTGPDHHYIAVRTDFRIDDKEGTVNPFINVYWPYVSIVVSTGMRADLPVWFLYGVSGVMSNTIVNGSSIQIGRTVPWYLQRLHNGERPTLPELVAVDRTSPWMRADRRAALDATAWGFMHYLMFGDNGAHLPALQRFVNLLLEGKTSSEALQLAFGNIDSLSNGFLAYLQRPIWSYSRIDADVTVKPNAFPVRTLTVAEHSAIRAGFHISMGRTMDARVLVDAAKAADPNQAMGFDVDAVLLERDRNVAAATTAYAKAMELGSTSFYTYQRWAVLSRANAQADQRVKAVQALERAVALNGNYAPSFVALAQLNQVMGKPEDALAAAQRAVELEPGQVATRLTLARALNAAARRDDARREAAGAMALAKTDADRRAVQQLIDQLSRTP